MTDIDLTPMNEAAARALFAEDLADQCARRLPETATAEERASTRIHFRGYALSSWDNGTVSGDALIHFRELALAATLVNWQDVARQAWQEGYKQGGQDMWDAKSPTDPDACGYPDLSKNPYADQGGSR